MSESYSLDSIIEWAENNERAMLDRDHVAFVVGDANTWRECARYLRHKRKAKPLPTAGEAGGAS